MKGNYNCINNKGFTLIELVATIALLSIISIISFVSINGVIEDNKVKDCENLISSINSCAKEYVSDNRYNSAFVNSVSDKKATFTAEILINNKYLTGKIVSPFDNNIEIAPNEISIIVTLGDDYTAKNVSVSRNSQELECSSDMWQ